MSDFSIHGNRRRAAGRLIVAVEKDLLADLWGSSLRVINLRNAGDIGHPEVRQDGRMQPRTPSCDLPSVNVRCAADAIRCDFVAQGAVGHLQP